MCRPIIVIKAITVVVKREHIEVGCGTAHVSYNIAISKYKARRSTGELQSSTHQSQGAILHFFANCKKRR